MKRKMKWVGILAGTCALACAFGIYNVANVQANAEETASFWTGFEITGAAVRTQDPVGLRFKTDVERLTPTMKKYNPDAEYYTVLTLTTGGKEYTTTRYADVWRPDGSGWNTVLLGIPESDYETKVTAQSFVKLNGKEQAVYQTEAVTVSIAQTAAAAMSYGATSEYITQYVDEIVTGVMLDQTSATLEVGQRLQLQATTTPSGYMAKWTTSDKNVVAVDNFGNVKAKGVGTATVTAEINGYEATCQITVTDRNETITAFASSATIKYSSKKISVSGTWLDGIFADERIDAVTFDVESDNATTLTTDFGFSLSLSANTAKNVAITRTMYDVWKANGASNLVLTSDYDFGWSFLGSFEITFTNFQKVWAVEESETLTKAELAELDGKMPDYRYNSYEFDFFGYSAMTDGTWREYDEATGEIITHFEGEDYRNVYRIEEYKEAGMTVMFPQSACAISASEGENFNFATSKLKEVMDMTLQAGMKKLIVPDYRLYALISEESLIGEGKQFASEAELDAKIKKLISPYVNHKAFYGVMLLDEPKYTVLEAYGQVYRSIKRCFPDAYVQCNLVPPVGATVGTRFPTPSAETKAKYTALGYDSMHAERFAAYEEYLEMFLDYTGADYIMYDQYPLTDLGIYECYVGGMQVTADVCAERGVDFKFVSQTSTMRNESIPDNERFMSEEDLRYLNNMALGFGVKQLAYFTYITRDNNFYADGTLAEEFLDGGSFINRDGTKTDIYYLMREILAENQAFASTILSFDYTTSATYIANGYAHSVTNAVSTTKGNFAKVSNVSVNMESALVSELYDKYNNRYMYMAQNITDSQYTSLQTVKLTFNEDYQYAIVWKNGEKSVVRLENNEYVAKLNSGEAVYVIPFNDQEKVGVNVDTNQGDTLVQFPTKENSDGWIKAEIFTDTATGDCIVFFPGVDEERMPWEKIG